MSSDFNSLTTKQKKVYNAIEAFIKQKNIPPTVREIGEMVGEKTPGAVQGILNRLEQKGVIKRELGMARSIQLVSNNTNYSEPVYLPEIKKISKRNVNDFLNMYNIKKYQPLPPDFIKEGLNYFMIDCPDNSMLESGIKYEDVLIICTDCKPQDQDIILLLYENFILLRRYFNRAESDNTIQLEADSDLLNKNIFSRDEITVIGKLVGKYTRY